MIVPACDRCIHHFLFHIYSWLYTYINTSNHFCKSIANNVNTFQLLLSPYTWDPPEADTSVSLLHLLSVRLSQFLCPLVAQVFLWTSSPGLVKSRWDGCTPEHTCSRWLDLGKRSPMSSRSNSFKAVTQHVIKQIYMTNKVCKWNTSLDKRSYHGKYKCFPA